MRPTCHQYEIRLRFQEQQPRKIMSLKELRSCTVEPIAREHAKKIIVEYEWLGTMPRSARACYGLITPNSEIVGVTVFGIGHGTEARKVCGDKHYHETICLERGTCTYWCHPHSASYLIPRSCRLAHQEYGWRIFYAYADPAAGEIGTVYQSCNWDYLGQGIGRNGESYHSEALYLPTGEKYSGRQLRNKNIDRYSLRDSPNWELRRNLDKHKYIWLIGTKRERKQLKAALRYPLLPYPKRNQYQSKYQEVICKLIQIGFCRDKQSELMDLGLSISSTNKDRKGIEAAFTRAGISRLRVTVKDKWRNTFRRTFFVSDKKSLLQHLEKEGLEYISMR